MSKAMRKRGFQNGAKTTVGRKWVGQFQVIAVIVTPITKQCIQVSDSQLLCRRLATMIVRKKDASALGRWHKRTDHHDKMQHIGNAKQDEMEHESA